MGDGPAPHPQPACRETTWTVVGRSRDLPAHDIGRHGRQPIEPAFGRAEVDRYVLAFDVAGFGQAGAYRSGAALLRNPTTSSGACCVRAASGDAAAPPSVAKNCRRRM